MSEREKFIRRTVKALGPITPDERHRLALIVFGEPK